MRKSLAVLVSAIVLVPLMAFSQTDEWMTQYVTLDDGANGTLNRTTSVAVIDANDFVALVTRGSSDDASLINYLVGYVGADSVSGRLEPAPTGSEVGFWENILDRVELTDAFQVAGYGNLVFLANNDGNHNILVFELTDTAVNSTANRMETGTEQIWAIEVDSNGYVYVCDLNGDDTKTNEVKVYAPVGDAGAAWDTSHDSAPVATIDLPLGEYRGITASGDGTQVFVSQTSGRTILKFTGSPASGYTADASFDFTLSPEDVFEPEGTGVATPSVLGLGFMDDPGALFAAVDTLFFGGDPGGYIYGRVYVIDPATGTNNDTIDVAQWNFDQNGSFTDASGRGLSGGFTSVMDVDIEASEGAVYLQTWYGWAVEKWLFDGDLGTIVSVEKTTDLVPEGFSLSQNYPNPFNPGTTIQFEIARDEHVTLEIFNLLGQKVSTLLDQRMTAGAYQAAFNAGDLQSGMYFYKLEAGQFKSVKKMVLTK